MFFISTVSEHLSRECDVNFFTGFKSPLEFSNVYTHLKFKAGHMQYWKGEPKTIQETPTRYKLVNGLEDLFNRPGPARKLRLEQ